MRKRTTSPRLQTKRLILRALQPGDVDDVCALAGDRRIASTTLRIPHPYEPQHFQEWLDAQRDLLEQGAGINWAIVRREDRQLLGAIGLDIRPENESAELGYWVGVPFWRQGIAAEAARAVIRFAFDQMHLNRIQAHTMSRNPASGRVLQRIGMRHEGVLRQSIKKWGVFEDVELYGMLRDTHREQVPGALDDDVQHE